MSGRLRRAAALRVRPSDAGPVWSATSAVLTDAAQRFAEGVSVRCYPRASAPAPGCCYTEHGTILIDGDLISEPGALGGELGAELRRELATLTGVLIHECGHAVHTHPAVLKECAGELIETVKLLEEARMERRLCERHPEARTFVRACVKQLVAQNIPEQGTEVSRGEAGWLVTILGARTHAGTLPAGLRAPVDELARRALGEADARRLAALMRRVSAIADGDAEAMVKAAREYREIIGEPDGAVVAAIAALLGELAEAIGDAEASAQAAIAGEGDRSDGAPDGAPDDVCDGDGDAVARARELLEEIEATLGGEVDAAKRRADEAGRLTRGGLRGGRPSGEIPTGEPGGPPGPAELRAAAQLERELRRVRARRVAREGAMRPGRFHAPGAVRAAAARALGRPAQVEAFRRREEVASPLWAPEVAVLVDTSGSMAGHHEELGRVLWSCHRAVRRLGGRVAAAGFGNGAAILVRGAARLSRVPELRCGGGTGFVDEAVRACERELRLADRHRPRLCVVISDGEMYEADRERDALERLRRYGVAVVHVGIGRPPRPMGGDRELCVPNAAECGRALGAECRAAMERHGARR